jgi:hypothetical protein
MSRDYRDITRTRHDYAITIGGITKWGSRSEAARHLRLARTIGPKGGLIAIFHHAKDYTETHVDMCAGCKARPALWEMDCDGPYATASCGECDWWACVETQQRQLVATCRNLSPQHDEFAAQGKQHNCYAVVH